MASQAQPRIQPMRSSTPRKESTAKAEQDFLARVMVSVSASLDEMSEQEREQAVVSAERAVAHLQ